MFIAQDALILTRALAIVRTSMSMLTLAIDQVDRVAYLEKIRMLGNEARAAEMALLAGNVLDAEAILVNAGLSVRAIQLNIQLYNWER